MMIEILSILIYIFTTILLFGGIAITFFISGLALYDANKNEFNKTLVLARKCKLYNLAYKYFKNKYN